MLSSQVAPAVLMAEPSAAASITSPDLSLHIGPPTAIVPSSAAAASTFSQLPVEFSHWAPSIHGTPVHLPPPTMNSYQLMPPPMPLQASGTWLEDQYTFSWASSHHHLPFRGGVRSLEAAAALHAMVVRSTAASRLTAQRFPGSAAAKRSSRAPRMRWTSSLHARFVHAVDLLGGHERATPKSILELMDVKDLTLAHVKSHLQMYRTIKSTDKPAVPSDGSVEEDLAGEHQKKQEPLFNSSSSRRRKLSRVWMEINSNGITAANDAHRPTSLSLQIEETNGRSGTYGDDVKIPSLEFTLGRPDWPING